MNHDSTQLAEAINRFAKEFMEVSRAKNQEERGIGLQGTSSPGTGPQGTSWPASISRQGTRPTPSPQGTSWPTASPGIGPQGTSTQHGLHSERMYSTTVNADGPFDIDMFLLPLHLDNVGHLSKYWESRNSPPLKVVSERPSLLQLFHSPMAMFVKVPDCSALHDFKEAICKALYAVGVELPLATSSLAVNSYNGYCISRGTLKAHWDTIQQALLATGIFTVYLGQFGCKLPLPSFQKDFAEILDQLMGDSSTFDLAVQVKDPAFIYVFGIKGGKTVLDGLHGDKAYHAYIHKIFPGMVHSDDPVHWGTLEVRPSGRAASEKGKFLQAYSIGLQINVAMFSLTPSKALKTSLPAKAIGASRASELGAAGTDSGELVVFDQSQDSHSWSQQRYDNEYGWKPQLMKQQMIDPARFIYVTSDDGKFQCNLPSSLVT
ncbi:unnamed protein product [Symbiodinium sp. CCMP2592]|nr:unnamed protein product [Symbiodinium sp. CCMP2592]